MSIFSNTNYRTLITKIVTESKIRPLPLTFKSLAQAALIQAPYLTKVIGGQADLSQDQAYLIAQAMELKPEEQEFFYLLVEYERSGVADRKRKIKQQIDEARDRNLKIQRVVKAKSETSLTVASASYHLDVQCLIVHMALTVPSFAKNPKKICDVIDLSPSRLDGILRTLSEHELIAIDSKGSVKMLQDHLHLPTGSPLFQPRQAQLRAATSYRSATKGDPFDHSLQAMFSADLKTATEIKSILNEAVRKIEELAKSAKAEGVYQFGFDFIKWL